MFFVATADVGGGWDPDGGNMVTIQPLPSYNS